MPRTNVALAIILKITSILVFVTMVSLIKSARGVPVGEMVFFRSFFALLPIAVFLLWRGEFSVGIRTKRFPVHLARGLLGSTSMFAIFYGLTQLPLPEAVAIGYATPLLIVVLSAVFLGETVRLYRWSAVLIGLSGVLVIIWPRLTLINDPTVVSSGEMVGALAALFGALLASGAAILVRRLVETERSATVVIYFSLTSTVFGLCSIPLGWQMLDPVQFAMLAGAGIAGGIGQILLTESYRHADISIIAPFEYASMLFSLAIGYFIFSEVPTLQMLTGGAIVVVAGIFIILREHRLGLERRRARRLTPPQG